MTREEAKEVFINRGYVNVKDGIIFDGNKWRQSVEVITEWLKEQPCEDAISKQAAIDAICKVCEVIAKPSECRYRKGLFGGCKEYEAIKAIPSAELKESEVQDADSN